jgi:hypothetical protein
MDIPIVTEKLKNGEQRLMMILLPQTKRVDDFLDCHPWLTRRTLCEEVDTARQQFVILGHCLPQTQAPAKMES